MTKIDRVEQAVQRLNTGLTGVFFENYIAGAMPLGWQLDHGIFISKTFDGTDRIIVHAKVWSRRQRPVGARILVDASTDIQAIAAELAAELQRKINEHIETTPEFDEIRYSLVDGATAPARGSDGASGYDLYAISRYVINPGQIVVIDTGVILELPRGTEGQVRGRSGMTKRGLWVALGTVDSDYRGTVGATVINHARETQTIDQGDRVAQLVIAEVLHRSWLLVGRDELSTTARGDRGWGSTGR